MDNKEWRDYSVSMEELLDLELNPVAISRFGEPFLESFDRKVRVCKGILQAGKGETIQISKENNACFGAAWHLGFRKVDDPRTRGMIEKFVVEGEKLFSSYEALHNLISQMEDVPDNSDAHFVLCPMGTAEFEPELVIFVCDAEAACRILTLAVFIDGNMPKIKIGGPTCRMAITYPLVAGELNISFYDYTARKMCGVESDKLLVTIPYQRIPKMVESIDKCSAGTAKVEYPQEFRELLRKRLTAGQKDR